MLRKLLLQILVCCYLPVAGAEGTILVLADSLSASYGIAVNDGWVSLLKDRLQEQDYNYRIINASISGDTTAGAVARLPILLDSISPEIAIVELGGNDGLRGIAPEEIRDNLGQILEILSQRDSAVLLLPMELPPNYGQLYIDRFRQLYADLSRDYGARLGKFILDGIVLERPELMQEDGIHPLAEAQPIMLDNIWYDLESMLTRVAESDELLQ